VDTGKEWSIFRVNREGQPNVLQSRKLDKVGNHGRKEGGCMRRAGTSVISILIVTAGFLGIIDMFSENALAGSWRIQTVDSEDAVGRYTSLALDSNGMPHISYYDETKKDLKYTHWDGDKWIVETIDSDGDVGRYASLALDSNDDPHIGYHDDTNKTLKYALWTGSSWFSDVVDSNGSVGISISITLDSQDRPHISYNDEGQNDLKYARWTGTMWSIETVDTLGGWHTSIKVDANNRPHISYYADNRLWYGRWNGTGWETERVDFSNQVGRYTSLELDGNEYPHISYLDNVNFHLKYARWTGAGWDIQTVYSTYRVGFYSSLALDASDHPHIAFHDDSAQHDLKYAEWTGTDWLVERVEWGSPSNVLGTYASLALDNGGYPHISYYHNTKSDLKYTTKAPTKPSAPLNLNATASDARIELAWEPPVSEGLLPITNYRIYRATASGQETFLVEIPGIPFHNDTSLTNGQIYYYKVGAVNAMGEGNLSNEANATPMTIPSPPINLIQSHGDDYVDMTWEPPLSDGGSPITNYTIFRGTSPGAVSILAVAVFGQQYNDTTVIGGTTYYYRVSATNSVGEGDLSNEVAATIPTVPEAPENLTAVGGDSYIRLTWSAPAWDGDSPITNYTIYRGLAPDGETLFVAVGNTLSRNDTMAENGVTYYYRVSASNRLGEGALSEETSKTPINEPPICSIVLPLSGTIASGSLQITGIASDPGEGIERVEVRLDEESWVTTTGTTSWTHAFDTTTLSNGLHAISARAFDGEDYSEETYIQVTVDNEVSERGFFEENWLLMSIVFLVIATLIATFLVLVKRRGRESVPEKEIQEESETEGNEETAPLEKTGH
jgi:fibronectin type 3 domain-containing protein